MLLKGNGRGEIETIYSRVRGEDVCRVGRQANRSLEGSEAGWIVSQECRIGKGDMRCWKECIG